MRRLLVFVVIVLVLVAVGWVTFTLTADRASVNVETDKIESDTRQLIQEGKQVIEDVGDSIDSDTDDRSADPNPNTVLIDDAAP